MKEEFIKKLVEIFHKNNIELTSTQQEKFYTYYSLLLEWNEKFNLTTITSLEDVIIKHFLDSVLGKDLIPQNAKVIDIGAGAGFPSLPLKILREDLNIFMLDSVNKKITFLQECINKLNLKNIFANHTRAEDLAKKTEFRESFDVSVARAVAQLNTLAEYCLPFIKIQGKMIAYKSSEIKEEINNSKKAISILGGKIEKVNSVNLEGVERKIIEIKKISNTPNKYPRSGNKPRLMPL